MTEQDKYEKAWDLEGYGKDWMNITLGKRYKTWITDRVPTRSTVTDFGCGNGTCMEWLWGKGYAAQGIDIARNANRNVNAIVGDLRNSNIRLDKTDFGICLDVMEHIPTDDVDKVLNNIADLCRVGCLFGIARDEDKRGREINEILHLTRKDDEWWNGNILKHFDHVEVLRTTEAAYCLWGIHD